MVGVLRHKNSFLSSNMNSSLYSTSFFQNLPCSEFPARCFLQCNDGKSYINCDGNGNVKLVDEKVKECQWFLIPVVSDDTDHVMVVIQNVETKVYLAITNNDIKGIHHQGHHWSMQHYPDDKYSFLHQETGKLMLGNHNNQIISSFSPEHDNNDPEKKGTIWNIELLTGELCYLFCRPETATAVAKDGISSATKTVILGTNENGKLYTDTKTIGKESGWDIWRFTETGGDGSIRIFLIANDKRLVYNEATDDVTLVDLYTILTDEQKDNWIVTKAPDKNHYPNGVMIQPAGNTHKYLFLKRQDKTDAVLKVVDTFYGAPCIWQCESANYNHFFIYSIQHQRRVALDSKLSVRTRTDKSKGAVWKLNTNTDGSISFHSNHFRRYLGYDDKIGITLSTTQQENERWELIELKNGLFQIVPLSHEQIKKKYLSSTKEGVLNVIEKTDDDLQNSDLLTGWYLEPVIPYKVTSSMIARNTAKGAILIGVLAIDPISQAISAMEKLGYALEAGEALASAAFPTFQPKAEVLYDDPHNFKSTSMYQISEEIGRTNTTSLGSSHPILNNLSRGCFISSTSNDVTTYLTCGMGGNVSPKKNSCGETVWVFDDAGDGFFVRIKSLTHNKYLCYDTKDNKLVTRDKCYQNKCRDSCISDLWNIKHERKSSEGVEIQTAYTDKYLQLKDGKVQVLDFDENGDCVWDLNVAHNHNFMLKTEKGNKWIITNQKAPSIASLKKKGSVWKIHREENETVTIYSESSSVYLGSDSNGNVHVSTNVQGNEEWLLAFFSDKKFGIISKKYGRFLSCGSNSRLRTESHYTEIVNSGECKWNLEPVLPFSLSKKQLILATTAGVTTVGLALVDPLSAFVGLGAIGIAREAFTGLQTAADYTTKATSGNLQADGQSVRNVEEEKIDGGNIVMMKSGMISVNTSDQKLFCDLVFLFTHTAQKNFIGCNDSGSSFSTQDPKGWSVWRLIHVANETYQIYSWAQDQYLCSASFSRELKPKAEDRILIKEESHWKISQAPSDDEGLIFQSVWNNRYLCGNQNEIHLASSSDTAGCVWNIEAANRRKFFLLCPHFSLRIGTDGRVPLTTNGMEKKLVWTVEEREGYVIIRSLMTNSFLGSDENGKVTVTEKIGENEKWTLHISPHGSVEIESYLHSQLYITCNKVGEIFTDSMNRNNYLPFQWKLEPALPQKDQRSENIMKYVTGASAIGLAVANPALALGAFSAIGFTTEAAEDGTLTSGFSGGESASHVDMFLANEDIKKVLKYDSGIFVNTSSEDRPFSCWRSW